MPVTTPERKWIFLFFLAFIALFAVLEFYIILTMVRTREVEALSAILAVANTGGLYLLFRLFATEVRRMFAKDVVDEGRLKDYFESRLSCILQTDPVSTTDTQNKITRELIGRALQFMERILNGWVGSHHYELSVFVNPEHPEIFCYYASGGQNVPHSQLARAQNPDYYKIKGYAVVELLEQPSDKIEIIPNTQVESSHYKFATDEQKKRICATALYCFATDPPKALVITCDRGGAFKQGDQRLKTLVNAVGLAIRCECEFGEKIVVPVA